MLVEAIALDNFCHGDINATRGRIVRHSDGSLIDSVLAADLEANGLVQIRTKPVAPVQPVGKPAAAGVAQPSSSSPAALASQPPTSNTLKVGATRNRSSAT